MSAPASCQACGGAILAPFHHDSKGALFRCADCGFVVLHPLPDPLEQAGLYAREGAGAAYFAKAAAKLARGRRLVRRIQKTVRGGRFLDAGCNGGFVVEAARERGFQAVGVEPDKAAVAWAREHYPSNTYFAETLESFAEGPDRFEAFDVVYCSEVIEHAPDANRFAASLASLLRPGGVLYLTTPDISHWRRPREMGRWDAYTPPEHCLYFTPVSLARLLDRHGLGVVRRRFAWKPGIKVFARKGTA